MKCKSIQRKIQKLICAHELHVAACAYAASSYKNLVKVNSMYILLGDLDLRHLHYTTLDRKECGFQTEGYIKALLILSLLILSITATNAATARIAARICFLFFICVKISLSVTNEVERAYSIFLIIYYFFSKFVSCQIFLILLIRTSILGRIV